MAERDDNRRAALDPLLHLPDHTVIQSETTQAPEQSMYGLGYRNWDIVKHRKSHHCCGFSIFFLLACFKQKP